MFENKGDDSSSPDRGRSPASRTPVDSDSPRPLSKIRSNFVAVNRNGQLGLSRDLSVESTSPDAQNSVGTDTEAAKSVHNAVEEPLRKVQDSNIPVPANLPPTTPPKRERSCDRVEGPNTALTEVFSLDSPSHADQTSALTTPDTTSISAQENGGMTQDSSILTSSPKETKAESLKLESLPTTTTVPRILRPHDTKDGSANMTTVDTKPMRDASRRREPKVAATANKTKTSTIPASSSQARSLQPRAGAEHTNAHTRLASKSPTKNARVPPTSVTAPAASSGARLNASRQRPSRQPHISQKSATAERSSSRSSVSTKGSSQRTGKPSSSMTSHSRPSFGPPPKRLEEHSKLVRDSHVDQDFLARMMRPTHSSSSKTTEKAPVTPPRKQLARRSSSSLARVKPKTGCKLASSPSSKKSLVENMGSHNINTNTTSTAAETSHSHRVSDAERSDDPDLGIANSPVDGDHDVAVSISLETPRSLDAPIMADASAEPPTVNTTDERRIVTPEAVSQ